MKQKTPKTRLDFDLLVMGASLGGIDALRTILGNLEPGFPVPIAVVLHRSDESDDTLCSLLQRHATLPIRDAEDKMGLEPGHVYLAPPGYHLLVEPGQAVLSIDAPVLKSRPSIDVLFESAADACGEKVAGVLLTGNNQDGARGLRRIEKGGGLCIVQDPANAEGRIMPEAGLASTLNAKVLPLEEIGGFLNDISKKMKNSD